MGGLSIQTPSQSIPEWQHKIFLLSNYTVLGAASSCIFLTLSLRLLPSWCGFLLILLHILTIGGAVTGCTAASAGSNKWYAAHLITTVVTAIFQGSVAVVIFSSTSSFLGNLKSYVREEDGGVILKLEGSLCVLIFCLEWLVLGLAFVFRYREFVQGGNGGRSAANGKVEHEDSSDWPWPFQV
ncbi:hypothetical protein DCAR_0206149 [Daucus carota subsp. sativus]|uniref:Uncharacterized protein n=1 Tax=Daucus carota subsp. sativus TaxID=79200 RepID=A0A161Y5L1_DAUCS|nr:PREDICTED: uncharacterized protein LOC108208009 [Daucus carota subsp. sativus]WOG86930.1 hypothetical protein DCAR_0206149 [Daucus carota subsp. sativus]